MQTERERHDQVVSELIEAIKTTEDVYQRIITPFAGSALYDALPYMFAVAPKTLRFQLIFVLPDGQENNQVLIGNISRIHELGKSRGNVEIRTTSESAVSDELRRNFEEN